MPVNWCLDRSIAIRSGDRQSEGKVPFRNPSVPSPVTFTHCIGPCISVSITWWFCLAWAKPGSIPFGRSTASTPRKGARGNVNANTDLTCPHCAAKIPDVDPDGSAEQWASCSKHG